MNAIPIAMYVIYKGAGWANQLCIDHRQGLLHFICIGFMYGDITPKSIHFLV